LCLQIEIQLEESPEILETSTVAYHHAVAGPSTPSPSSPSLSPPRAPFPSSGIQPMLSLNLEQERLVTHTQAPLYPTFGFELKLFVKWRKQSCGSGLIESGSGSGSSFLSESGSGSGSRLFYDTKIIF